VTAIPASGWIRRLAGALAAAGLALVLAAPPASARPVLFVGNLEAGTVSLVDAHSLRVLGELNVIPDGNTPRDPAQAAAYPALVKAKGVDYVQGLALSPSGRTLYVSRGYLGDVAAFDVASHRELWRLQVTSQRADHVALSADGGRLFVSALTTNQVQAIDTLTHSFVGSFATGDWPHVLEFSPGGRYIYNGSLGNQLLPQGAPNKMQLTVADARTLKVVRTLPFSAGVRPFVFSHDGRLLYVQFSYFNGFRVIDPVTGQILHTVNLPLRGPGAHMKPSDYPNQAAHHGIDISGDGKTICDAATISNYVALVARRSLKTEAIIPVGDQPAEAETSLDGRYCFVANRGPGSNSVSVISYAKRREVKRIRVGKHPQEETEGFVAESVLRAGGFLRSSRRHRTHSRTHGG
jgi:DNA-binding beta-propeller fold protein YncE